MAKRNERVTTIKGGDSRRNRDTGTIVMKQPLEKVSSCIEIAQKDGPSAVADWRVVVAGGAPEGFWLGPSLIDKVPMYSTDYQEEIFGPVLSVVRVQSYEEGLDLADSCVFGNGTAILTNDGGGSRKFLHQV